LNFDIIDFERVVPKPLLDFYLDKLESKADRRSIESMYQGILEKEPELTKSVFSNYRYAGRTAVNIFEEITLPAGFLTKERMEESLKKELDVTDIYNNEFQPTLSDSPQINFIEDRGDSIVIQFVIKGKERRVRDGYEIRTISSVDFELAIVRFMGPTLIELRCSYNRHGKFLAFFENLFQLADGFQAHRFEWTPITKVSNAEAEKIALKLAAGLIEADHKDEGIFDRHLVTASPRIRDLRQQTEYIEKFKNKMLLSQTLIISYTEKTRFGDYVTDIKFKINLYTGFQFLSKVSEPVIDYVMKVFIDIRYKQNNTDGEGNLDDDQQDLPLE
jgi:hypothetical protein